MVDNTQRMWAEAGPIGRALIKLIVFCWFLTEAAIAVAVLLWLVRVPWEWVWRVALAAGWLYAIAQAGKIRKVKL